MIARALADFFGGIWDLIWWVATAFGPATLPIVVIMVYGLVRVSLTFGPMKMCWRCKGKGYTKGWFGGKRFCPSCAGKGLRKRVGASR